MKALGLKFFTDTHLTLIGLLIFFGIFLLICFLQYKLYPKNKIQSLERLPLEDDKYEFR